VFLFPNNLDQKPMIDLLIVLNRVCRLLHVASWLGRLRCARMFSCDIEHQQKARSWHADPHVSSLFPELPPLLVLPRTAPPEATGTNPRYTSKSTHHFLVEGTVARSTHSPVTDRHDVAVGNALLAFVTNRHRIFLLTRDDRNASSRDEVGSREAELS